MDHVLPGVIEGEALMSYTGELLCHPSLAQCMEVV